MKNLKFASIFCVLIAVFLLTGCSGDTEPLDPAIENPIDFECPAPTDFTVGDFINTNQINLHWNGGQSTAWIIEYGPSGFVLGSGTQINVTGQNQYTVTDLDPVVDYVFYIRSACDEDSFSAWVGPVARNGQSIDDCHAPTGVQAARNPADPTTIGIQWNDSSALSWKIQYGPAGFAFGSGTTITVTENSYVFTGLTATQAYDFYVVAVCSDTSISSWTSVTVGTGTTNPSQGNFTVDIDGTAFVATNVVASRHTSIDPTTGPDILTSQIAGISGTKMVTAQFTENGTTTYDIPDSDGAIIGYTPNVANPTGIYSSMDPNSTSTIGNIAITANDLDNHIISGAFQCKVFLLDMNTGTVTATAQLTNGIFTNVHYTLN